MVREAIRPQLRDAAPAESTGRPANGFKQKGTQSDLHFQELGGEGGGARWPGSLRVELSGEGEDGAEGCLAMYRMQQAGRGGAVHRVKALGPGLEVWGPGAAQEHKVCDVE